MFKRKNFFTKQPTIVKILLVAVPVLILWKIFRGGWKLGGDIKNAIKNDQQAAAINKVALDTGLGAERAQSIIDIAKDIHVAFHGTLWGLGEDEEKAVNALNRCQSAAEAKAVAVVYRTNYQKSLYGDFKQYSGTFIDPWPRQNLMDAIKSI